MSYILELSAGNGWEHFPLNEVSWDPAEFSGTLCFQHNPTKFANIIDMYIGMIKSDLENKHPNISLKYPGKDDKEIDAYAWDIHQYHLHVSRLWRWIAMNPLCVLVGRLPCLLVLMAYKGR